MLAKDKPNNFFEPIDLGLNIKFDPIIQPEKTLGHNTNEWGFEPLIKPDDTPKNSLGTDVKDMAQSFKKDYDDLSRGLQYMKTDFAPKANKLIKKIRKTKLISPFKLKLQFKNPKSYNPDDAYIKS